ncbi:hypothetical protein [Pseudomonas sediminis]|uniref:UDP-3-O-(3-hydroxymyristoyl)glucosamine N-acyltransferase n=1 Tax=Pseudomonas sediminis TaxID=1691904 RepID=A0ABX6SCM0_9PSED|nr:hypothetical protein [Pseudomonas sediminis]QNG99603.1 hypothetical protein HNQ25_14980 [Pseudomonas sediminis]
MDAVVVEISLLRAPLGGGKVLELLSKVSDGSGQLLGRIEAELLGVCDARKGGRQCIVFTTSMDSADMERLLESCFVITEVVPESTVVRNCYYVVEDARAVYIDLLAMLIDSIGFRPFTSIMAADSGISESAVIAASAIIESGVVIGEGAVVSDGCVIRSGTQIGKNSIVRENSVVGSDGITLYKSKNGRLMKFPHVCGVYIGEGCEIGAGCVIPRGILTSTRVGDQVVIGNLCNIGHGASLADGVWMSVGSLVGGHTYIGAKSTIGMGARIRDNLRVGDGVSIGMGSVVVKDIEPGHSVFGNPARRMAALATGPKR